MAQLLQGRQTRIDAILQEAESQRARYKGYTLRIAQRIVCAMSKFGAALIPLLVVSATQAEPACHAALPPPQKGALPLAKSIFSRAVGPPRGSGLTPRVDPAYSVERVLERRRWEACRQAIALALAPSAVPVQWHADYVKHTEFDNTPFRFNMTQNGKRMTADDFDAWLEMNGYSVGRRVSDTEP